jgi:anaerobic magnesium-protoporphyrin IX monomethyl ester cyclase
MIFPVNQKNRNGPVILVSQPIAFTVPFSFAYLAGYLKQKGENVTIVFRPSDPADIPKFVQGIIDLNPVLVGFGSLYPELNLIRNLIRSLDESGRTFPVVVGGQMVTPLPEFAVRITGADFGVIGEGEIILYELVQAIRHGTDVLSVKGLAVNDGGTITLTGPGEFINDLSDLPPIPYELFPDDWITIGKWHAEHYPLPFYKYDDRVITVHGGRGCPFNCNFCYHHSKPRYRPIPLIVAEAREALERFDANMIDFSDDLVLASPQRARQLVSELRAWDRKVSYRLSTRFDILSRIDDALLQDLRDTGCRVIALGVESGSDRMLKIIGKNTTADNILFQLDRLKKAGILVNLSIMVGQYTETREDVEASISLMQQSVRNNPNVLYHFMITTPFPGSELYNILKKNGYIRNDQEFYDAYFSRVTANNKWTQVFNLSAMTEQEVLSVYALINKSYAREKRKHLNPLALGIEAVVPKLGGLNDVINHKFFSNVPERSVRRSVRNAYAAVFDHTMIALDRTRLRLRGLQL